MRSLLSTNVSVLLAILVIFSGTVSGQYGEDLLNLFGEPSGNLVDVSGEHEEHGEDLLKLQGRRRLRCQKIDSLGSEEYSASYPVRDGTVLALRLVPGYDRHITHNVNFYLWDHSYIRSPHSYISRIGLFNAWPWTLVSYHRDSEASQESELMSPPTMGRWMLMHVNIKEGQAEVVLTVREGESYTITTPVPAGDLYLTAGRYNVMTPAYQVAWGCQVIEYSHTEL
ncbi:unnamed protein product [Meganyctiphanes norvegica]|uniref:Uncharacterized protein n=1 Tax=Meganyctiphanes norvegica TaxID=48144 RepID=A0AAV2PQF7_MEGNR